MSSVLVLSGIGWAIIAVFVQLAVFRGVVPPPGDLPLPLAIVLVLSALPFLVAIFVETGVGRSSPQVAEVVLVTALSGPILALVIAGLIVAATRARAERRRSGSS